MQDQFRTIAQLLAGLKSPTRKTVKHWAARGLVRRIPKGRQRGSRYSESDFNRQVKQRHTAPLPDEFDEDGLHWIWIELAAKKYHLHADTIYSYCRSRPDRPAEGLRRIVRERIGAKPAKGVSQNRVYVHESELLAILAWIGKSPEDETNWLDHEEASKIVPPHVLRKHSDGGAHKDREPGTPHRALQRCFKTKTVRVPSKPGEAGRSGPKTHLELRWWKPDLERVANPSKPELWATREEAIAEYGITNSELTNEETAGRIDSKRFPVPPTASRKRTVLVHFFRPHLRKWTEEKSAAQVPPAAPSAPPATSKGGRPQKVDYIDEVRRWREEFKPKGVSRKSYVSKFGYDWAKFELAYNRDAQRQLRGV